MVIWTVGYQFNQRNIFQFGFFEFHLQCRQQYIKLAKLLFFAMNLNRLQILIGILGRCQCGSSHKGPEGNGNPKKKRFALPLGLMWRCQFRISNIVVCTENPKMEGYYRLCSEAKRSQAEETPCSPWPSGPACSPPSSCSPCPSGAPFKPSAPAPWSHRPPRPAIRCSSEAEQLLVHAAQSLEQLGGFERGRCVRWHITHHSLTRRANCSEETVND